MDDSVSRTAWNVEVQYKMKNIVNYLVRFIENCYRIMLCGVWTASCGSPSLRSLHKWRNEMTWCVAVDDNNWRVRLNT